MVWQYLQIVLRVLARYVLLRLRYVRSGSWLMHRYQTGHMLLSKTIELCEERRILLVMAERNAAQKKAEKIQRKNKVYSGIENNEALQSVSPQQEK